jgi:uncharacterized protein (DUF58 family)
VSAARRTFRLVPRRRLQGTPFGERRSTRRGRGVDVAGARPYVPGDPVQTIDWFASARASAASGEDQFVVRETYAEESPRVQIVVDRRPEMAIYGGGLPFLDKRGAVVAAAEAIARSAAAARAEVGEADAAGGRTHVLSPGAIAPRHLLERIRRATFDAPPGSLGRTLAALLNRRADLPQGTFVFVLSDFLEPLRPGLLSRLRASLWEVVPVVVQDPTWEQSFPAIGGVVVPYTAPGGDGEEVLVRLSASEATRRRRENEIRLDALLRRFRSHMFDPLVLGDASPAAVDAAFLHWSRRRQLRLRAR